MRILLFSIWKLFVTSFFLLIILARLGKSSVLFGFRTKSASFISSTTLLSKNGVTIKHDFEWIRKIGRSSYVGLIGDSSDCELIFNEIFCQTRQQEINFGENTMTCDSLANLCRYIISEELFRGRHLSVDAVIVGYNHKQQKPMVYWLDSVGSMKEVEFAAHGDEFPVILSLFDQQNNAMMTTKQTTTTTTTPTTEAADDQGNSIERKRYQPLISMAVDEAKRFVGYCWDTTRKRKTDDIGQCRLLMVDANGCKDCGSIFDSNRRLDGRRIARL